MKVITRFAPSPTGYLHIGGVRTALFNWLFAKNNNGLFKLRIEDTDLKRSTQEAKEAIMNGLKWLDLNWDQEEIYQSKRIDRHKEIGNELLRLGYAYKCYCSPEELTEMREKAKKEKKAPRYNGKWREKDESEAPKDIKPVIRIKCPQTGSTNINDIVQGNISIKNNELDDFIIIRSDGTPTYMLSVVVDDFDMGVTHVIRGDDHFTNTFRQKHIYNALNWELPKYAHIPLIHGMDGGKLSKRHGALGVDSYDDMGYLKETMLNYLLRLGWSHGDKEIISKEEAIKLFNLDSIGKSSAKFDIERLTSLNAYYIENKKNEELVLTIKNYYANKKNINITNNDLSLILNGMNGLKTRARTINELAEMCSFYIEKAPITLDKKSKKVLNNENINTLKLYYNQLSKLEIWNKEEIEEDIKMYCQANNINLGKLAQPLRAAITGKSVSPGLYELMEVLGKNETLARITNINN
ncbi:MAG: Glutamate--tRNA ligase [Alphaproteobacteria bacterium MarineAlpha9_Bin3]|mgnify:CR=1 FL=1|nr:MAG: Glutamate--tRNA ligase [Alphaproteobacteria bacterium MarineAlpha9_Bin3]|tara:strand:- start:23640 stop:25040 length:1401 start_codon:yes stop_codon:yes gene_type:complete